MYRDAKTEIVYIALGSNLGDRANNIHLALEYLQDLSDKELVTSSLWESEAVDCPEGSGNFLNSVVQLATSLTPRQLLVRLQEIEMKLGRSDKRAKNAPRTIDLDIVCHGNRVVADADLVVPHPRAKNRHFVLQPLAEIAPDLYLPGCDKTVSSLLSLLPSIELKRIC